MQVHGEAAKALGEGMTAAGDAGIDPEQLSSVN